VSGHSLKGEDETEPLTVQPPKDRDSQFRSPDWASLPRPKPGKTFYVEIWKNSKMIARLNIGDRKAYVFGRHETFANIKTVHESISRQHAALIYYGKKRSFYLVDMKSFHGTFVNDFKITPWVPVQVDSKTEIKFGASSRIYMVRESDIGLEKEEEIIEENPKLQQVNKRPRLDPVPQQDILYHCSHLLVKHSGSRNPTSWRKQGVTITRSKETALQLLNHYRAQIDRGEFTFSELAKRYSDCTSASKGGELAPFKLGTMQPDFEKAVLALDPGEMTNEPIETDSGVHMIIRHK